MDKNSNSELLLNLDHLHTTTLGIQRVKRNLGLETDDVVDWCRSKIQDPNSSIMRRGKNWYVRTTDCEITVNTHSYTVITAHKIK